MREEVLQMNRQSHPFKIQKSINVKLVIHSVSYLYHEY